MAEPVVNIPVANDDDEGQEAEEGEGKRLSDADDSSEEEDEDEDAVREVREGFIVDEERTTTTTMKRSVGVDTRSARRVNTGAGVSAVILKLQ